MVPVMPELMGMPRAALTTHLDAIGVGAHHGPRVFRGLHQLALPLEAIPDLGRHAAVIAEHTRAVGLTLVEAHDAGDGTVKLELLLGDGARVEAVVVPMQKGRDTLCVSTQVGCAMACAFCATGRLGLSRHLTAGEVVTQVHIARAWAEARGRRITRLVFMGMGEPLHAYDTTAAALRVLLDDHGVNYGSKHVTVSTVGLVDRLRRFGRDFGGRVQLAISLHAGTDATRRRIVPAARAADLASLRQAVLDHPLPGSRKVMVEYVVLPGVNDSTEELDGVAAWVDGLPCVVNLIPFNPFEGSGFRSPTDDEVSQVFAGLRARGVPVSVRWPRGRGAHGACGQLALLGASS